VLVPSVDVDVVTVIIIIIIIIIIIVTSAQLITDVTVCNTASELPFRRNPAPANKCVCYEFSIVGRKKIPVSRTATQRISG